MRKIYFALFVILQFAFVAVSGQQNLSLTKDLKKPISANIKATLPTPNTPANVASKLTHQKCGFSYIMNKAKANGYNDNAFEAQVARIIETRRNAGESFTGTVTLPIIFHVVYRNADVLGNSSANLNTAKFQAQVNQLNLDYGNLSGSTYGVAADVRIRFCMAVVDTAGRPLTTAGIDRINGETKGWTNTDDEVDPDALINYFDATIKPATIWDPFSYVNVWSAAMTSSGLLGYSTFPVLSTLAGLEPEGAPETNSTAGVVIAWESVGSVASPGADVDYGYGRTLTHELGHYFGLRHIWGDYTCGNDYCADTPPQDDATSGCPAVGTLNNCTPSGPKMFQNYMDYSNDACLNTFTANQASRNESVMDNSPRRLSLISSKACATRPGNSIAFIYAGEYSASETGTAGTCPNTKSYAFRLYPSVQATGAATVTFTTLGTSTAVLNQDFIVSTPTVSFTNGDAAAKTVVITIIDDQVKEIQEKIVLGFTISGTGVIAGPDKQTIILNIIDDEGGTITADPTTSTKTILSESFAAASLPTGWTTQVYDDGSASYTPNQWVVSANGGSGTTGNAAHITQNITTKPNTYNNVNTSDAYLYTPLIDASGLKDINVSFKWRCRGEAGYDAGFIGYIPEGQVVTSENVMFFNTAFYGQAANPAAVAASLNLPANMWGTKFYFVFNWYNDNTTGNNPPFTIDDIVFTGKNFTIASTLDADTSFSLFNGQSANFYSKNNVSPFDNRIIASVNNLNANVGCIGASVQNIGTGQTSVTTNSGLYTRSDKVIKLTPATPNPAATYQVTLYYSTAELATWGANVSTLKMLKVNDATALTTTLTNLNAQLFNPTINDQRTTKGYASFTANVTGGFSQFMLAAPTTTIPVSLINFEAKGNVKNISLTWNTATELNNRGFVIERSTNAIDFEKIGWVDGKLNSSVQTNYQFVDNYVQPNIVYYYRLRQRDLDNRDKISDTRQAKIKGADITVSISPNPAKDLLKVFVSGSTGLSDIQLVNAAGQVVRNWKQVNATSAAAALDISRIAPGMYALHVVMPQSAAVEKLIIK